MSEFGHEDSKEQLKAHAEAVIDSWVKKGYDGIGSDGKSVYPCNLEDAPKGGSKVDDYFPIPSPEATEEMIITMENGWNYDVEA